MWYDHHLRRLRVHWSELEHIGSGTEHQPPLPPSTQYAAASRRLITPAETMDSKGRRRPLMRRVAMTLGLLLPNFDQVSDAFVFHLPTPKQSTAESSCRDHAAVVAASRAFESTSSLEARGGSSSCVAAGRQAAGIGRQRHRRQVGGCVRTRDCCVYSSCRK